MASRAARAKLMILRVLHEAGRAAGASRIAAELTGLGLALHPRTVRLYLLQLDAEGMTRLVGRRLGREITERGREELAQANVIEKVGFIAAKVDTLGYRMTFDNGTGTGSLVTNVALIDRRVAGIAMREMVAVFEAGLGMGRRLAIAEAGAKCSHLHVPDGKLGIGTVCSVTLNGILLHEGIPVTSRFGGLVQMRDGEPMRFVELIDYGGTTMDPMEVFIKAGMTRVKACAASGSGIIGASFREVPSAAVDDMTGILGAMARHGLGGVLLVGKPNRPLLDIPVADGRTGIIVTAGLNPVAAVHEAGVRVDMQSLAGLADAEAFRDFGEAVERYEKPAETRRKVAGL